MDVNLPSLRELVCQNNNFTTIDLSRVPNLTKLDCSNNLITEIDPSLLPNLLTLSCGNNELTSMDTSTNLRLNQLWCSGNQLIILNIKNGYELMDGLLVEGLEMPLEFNNNPNLAYICFDDSASGVERGTVQLRLNNYGYTDCVINSYCSFVPGGEFYTIQGQSIFDSNSNGCDINDLGYSYLNFQITNGLTTGSLTSNYNGGYYIPVQAGTHIITPVLENPTYWNISPLSITVDFPTDTSPYNQDFCVTPNGVHNDLEITVLPINGARPGFDANYKLVYKNKGNTTFSGNVAFDFNDDLMDFL